MVHEFWHHWWCRGQAKKPGICCRDQPPISSGGRFLLCFYTWWLIPVKRLITPVISGISRVNPPIALVGGLEHDFYDFPCIGKNNPNWLKVQNPQQTLVCPCGWGWWMTWRRTSVRRCTYMFVNEARHAGFSHSWDRHSIGKWKTDSYFSEGLKPPTRYVSISPSVPWNISRYSTCLSSVLHVLCLKRSLWDLFAPSVKVRWLGSLSFDLFGLGLNNSR